MRLDLYNYTISLGHHHLAWRNSAQHIHIEKLLYALRYHKLDGVAITNRHNIEMAMALAKEYPSHIIIGCEYQVVWAEKTSVYITVLNVSEKIHPILMKERLYGLKHFCAVVQNERCPFFMSRLGEGIPFDHPFACELFEESLQLVPALSVQLEHESSGLFSKGLARYYKLALIGGSGHLICSQRRTYTESIPSRSLEEFWQAMFAKKISIGFTYEIGFPQGTFSSLWELSKNFYRKEIQDWQDQSKNWETVHTSVLGHWIRLGQAILSPLFYSIPQTFQMQNSQNNHSQLESFGQKFVVYLKNKQTQEIYLSKDDKNVKKNKWVSAIAEISACFQPELTPSEGFPIRVHN